MSIFKKGFKKHKRISPEGFRYRGIGSSRLENLTDTVFGFSITLLVIASEVPRSYTELQASMYSFIGFIFCILLLLGIWNNHRNFFLHYGLIDTTNKILNFLFLFVLLFYIYPLKFLFSYLGTAIYARIKLAVGDKSEALRLALDKLAESNMNQEQWADIMIRFGLGLLLIYFIFWFMHKNALRKRKILALTKREVFITRSFLQSYVILMAIAFLSMLVVIIFGGRYAAISGYVYLLVPILLPLQARYRKKRLLQKVWKNKIVAETPDAENLSSTDESLKITETIDPELPTEND
ncbi:TMEM175 family protein [Flavobacteriaceae bacterium M23B6Z8]